MDATTYARTLLASRRPGHSLPQAFYADPNLFALEMETLFLGEWLFAGHACEIPEAGDYLTHRIGMAEAIVVRGADGAIRAFHNACRHRGSRLCANGAGNATRLVCPYHQWTYDLDGRLLFAREMGPGFDPRDFALKPVACEQVAGYLFVCFARVPPDFEPVRQRIEPYMLPHRLEYAKVAHQTSIIERGNWKLVWENNRECYHCAGSHPELCRTYTDAPTMTGVADIEADDFLQQHVARCEAAGLPSRFHLDPGGQFRVMRVPLLRDTESFTMSGRPASAKPLGAIREARIGSMLLFHYPTTWNHLLRDHAVSFQVTPLGPRETRVTTKWLVRKDAVEGIDYDLGTLTEVWEATNDQDRTLVEQNQMGVDSPAYEPGPYSTVHESGVNQFVDWYCAAFAGHLGQEAPLAAAVG
ncbi:aromatic ring-hydroxylating dioxygenase subunit alpha [Marivibrio halodurans]|uniref:Aromatic ring-hydroxylating dioxygenase subunit alpha n=1 Tax=Marivibrio halodurans TaxID=2039722 RepID=A0A8J7S052_9PROT|nr:aromatic ring-hydroxylating dioxygenase subunit alpha [Marivibrio halodurans]MBP5856243.1 aromatic ring-hydroxylating dioxygenase subunit alpha [Marivibrio halodurans]